MFIQMPMKSTAIQGAVSTLKLLAYGGLAMPMSLALIPIVTYLPAFYAQELKLSAGLVGAVFLLARLWDGLFDIVIGWLSDRSTSCFGRRKFWVMLGTPFLMASTWFLCNPPAGAGLIYLAVCASLFYTAWTAMCIPYLSWGTELSDDYVERNRVTSFREAFTMVGNLFFASAPLLFLGVDAPLHKVLWLIAITVLWMVPLAVIPLALFVGDPPIAQRPRTRLLQGIASLSRDRVLLRFMAAVLMIYVSEGVINSLIVFSLNVGLQLPGKLFWIIFIIYVTTVCSLPFAVQLGKRFEKHWLLVGGITLKAIGFGAHLFVPMGNFPTVVSLWIMIGVGHTFMVVLPASILADVIDNAEVSNRERRPGAYVAIFNLALKLGMAVGVGLAFGLLEVVNYDPSAANYAVTDARNIRLLSFGLPAALLIPAIALLLAHTITKDVQRELRQAIDSRTVSSSEN